MISKYSKVAILFHWLIAALVIANFVLASMAEDLPREAQGACPPPALGARPEGVRTVGQT